ncbi:MAG: AraC family transcriptional regulator [Pyrinomonadaceae bacterium]|nr:AraC family transcriptional regulator [Pyrinomonadaceae bacterium]
MEFQVEEVEDFMVVGIAVRVDMSNAADLIGGLWQRWFREGIAAKIRNKSSTDTYNIYTNYEGDHTKPYTCFLGCRVDSLDRIPDRMQAIDIKGGKYAVFDVAGKIPDAVMETWMKIYQMDDLERTFTADFDVYGEGAANPENAKLQTFVAIK